MAATLTRGFSGLLRPLSVLGRDFIAPALTLPHTHRFSTVVQKYVCKPHVVVQSSVPVRRTVLLHSVKPLMPSLNLQPNRSLTYYSVKKGKRKSVKSVVKRFLRLHCGLWVRRRAGYKKKLWKKSPARKKRLREHVFCNKTQSKLLDKMTTSFWKRRNWFLNDPYQKYHDRVNLKL